MSRMMAATIRGGVAVSDDFADLPDGTAVTVTVVLEPEDDFELTPEQETELIARIAEADRGDTLIPADEVMRDFEARRRTRVG